MLSYETHAHSSSLHQQDPNAPKRPASAFLKYSRTRRTILLEENRHLKNTDISKLLGKEWKAASQQIRQPYIDEEAREREAYHKKISAWREQKRQNEKSATSPQKAPSPTNFPDLCQGPGDTIEARLPQIQALQVVKKPVTLSSCSVLPDDTTASSLQRLETLRRSDTPFTVGSMTKIAAFQSDHETRYQSNSLPFVCSDIMGLGHLNDAQRPCSAANPKNCVSATQKPSFLSTFPSPIQTDALLDPQPISLATNPCQNEPVVSIPTSSYGEPS